MTTRRIWCCGCGGEVDARLTHGREIYPHRRDLVAVPFWKCDACRNFVGCHHKTADPTKPLGCIPTPALKEARQHIHRILDPIWKSGRMPRKALYRAVAARIGVKEYHTAEIRDFEQARAVYRAVQAIAREV